MNRNELISFMAAYGLDLTDEDRKQYKMRFSGRGVFVDVWNGNKGMTMGFYWPSTQRMTYKRKVNPNQMEKFMKLLEYAV